MARAYHRCTVARAFLFGSRSLAAAALALVLVAVAPAAAQAASASSAMAGHAGHPGEMGGGVTMVLAGLIPLAGLVAVAALLIWGARRGEKAPRSSLHD